MGISSSPMWFPCKSLVSPIFLPFLGTDLQRFHNGGITDLRRRLNEGCNRVFGDWCNTLESITPCIRSCYLALWLLRVWICPFWGGSTWFSMKSPVMSLHFGVHMSILCFLRNYLIFFRKNLQNKNIFTTFANDCWL